MSDEIYVVCPACVSFVSKDSVSEAEELAKKHNEPNHEGEIAIPVNIENNDELKSVLKKMKILAPGEEYQNFVRRLRKGNGPFFCPAKKYKSVVPEEDQRL